MSAPAIQSPSPRTRGSTAATLFGAVLIVGALAGVAVISAAGGGTLQGLLQYVGIGHDEALAQEQRRQAAAISKLERMLQAVASDVRTLGGHAQADGAKLSDVTTRLAQVDSEMAALREEIAREGLYQQDTVLRGALYDLAALQTAFDERELTLGRDVAAINRRIDQLESAIAAREVTSSIPNASAAVLPSVTPTKRALARKPLRRKLRRSASIVRSDAMQAPPTVAATELTAPRTPTQAGTSGNW